MKNIWYQLPNIRVAHMCIIICDLFKGQEIVDMADQRQQCFKTESQTTFTKLEKRIQGYCSLNKIICQTTRKSLHCSEEKNWTLIFICRKMHIARPVQAQEQSNEMIVSKVKKLCGAKSVMINRLLSMSSPHLLTTWLLVTDVVAFLFKSFKFRTRA
jgi:hypothetical protein